MDPLNFRIAVMDYLERDYLDAIKKKSNAEFKVCELDSRIT